MESINGVLWEAINRQQMPQCSAKTLADRRCLRLAEAANGLCASHDPTRQCHGWNFRRDRQCGNNSPPDSDLCAPCQREHEKLGWDECSDEDCDYHNDEHAETQGRIA